MSVWATGSTAVSTTLNVVTSAATAVDRSVSSVDHASRYLEERSRIWADAGVHAARLDATNAKGRAEDAYIERSLAHKQRIAKLRKDPAYDALWVAEEQLLKAALK